MVVEAVRGKRVYRLRGNLNASTSSHVGGPLFGVHIRVGLLGEHLREHGHEILRGTLGEEEGLAAGRGEVVLRRVGDVGDETVLLIGNGTPNGMRKRREGRGACKEEKENVDVEERKR